MDFDDILLYTYKLLNEHEDVRRKYVERFRYVLVDEYQDTNFAQHLIVWQLTKERQHVCVVGDDAQSIYSFRGANIDNILKFKDLYGGCKVFKLEQNYRSTKVIVNAANSLISKNKSQIQKDVFSEKETGDLIKITEAYSDIEEGQVVMRQIEQIKPVRVLSLEDSINIRKMDMEKEVLEFNDAFFSPKVFDSREVEITPYTYAIHHYQNSWFSPKAKAYYRSRAFLVKLFGQKFVRKAEIFLMPWKFKK
jgi:DNA helicase-2/ATP-dependent DNA helicase PcrA